MVSTFFFETTLFSSVHHHLSLPVSLLLTFLLPQATPISSFMHRHCRHPPSPIFLPLISSLHFTPFFSVHHRCLPPATTCHPFASPPCTAIVTTPFLHCIFPYTAIAWLPSLISFMHCHPPSCCLFLQAVA